MTDLQLQDIYIYPIKSLGGITVQEAEVQQTGLQYDRRWMLTDNKYNFISQRECPPMALLQVSFGPDCLIITHKKQLFTPLAIPFDIFAKEEVAVRIWDDVCAALEVGDFADSWFSKALNMPVHLMYMPATASRFVDPDFIKNNDIVSFADAYPLMMIGQASLDDLNRRLEKPVAMNRFRPNLVFKGGDPYFEDSIGTFKIADITFTAVKPCERCVITTIDQEHATKGSEPLKTLSAYRTYKNKVMFGQNLLYTSNGIIKVGDKLIV